MLPFTTLHAASQQACCCLSPRCLLPFITSACCKSLSPLLPVNKLAGESSALLPLNNPCLLPFTTLLAAFHNPACCLSQPCMLPINPPVNHPACCFFQENLRWEQRTVLQFNWVLLNRIMSPIQTALFMVHAWPSHCDCLALVNAIHALKDKLLVSTTVPPLHHPSFDLCPALGSYNLPFPPPPGQCYPCPQAAGKHYYSSLHSTCALPLGSFSLPFPPPPPPWSMLSMTSLTSCWRAPLQHPSINLPPLSSPCCPLGVSYMHPAMIVPLIRLLRVCMKAHVACIPDYCFICSCMQSGGALCCLLATLSIKLCCCLLCPFACYLMCFDISPSAVLEAAIHKHICILQHKSSYFCSEIMIRFASLLLN